MSELPKGTRSFNGCAAMLQELQVHHELAALRQATQHERDLRFLQLRQSARATTHPMKRGGFEFLLQERVRLGHWQQCHLFDQLDTLAT